MFYLLTSYYIDHAEDSKNWFLVFKYILQYLIRNWFSIGFVLVFGICFLFWIGGGPLYTYSYNKFVWDKWCYLYWWSPLFFASSVFPNDSESECFNWLWLISCEFISFIFLCIIFEIYWWSIWLAFIVCGMLIGLCLFFNAFFTIVEKHVISVMSLE